MTIHQPSARLYQLLDQVIFMSKGRTTYQGSAKQLLPFTTKVYDDLQLGEIDQANAPELFLDLCDRLQETNKISYLTDMFSRDAGKETSLTRGDSQHDTPAEIHFANSIVGDVTILCERQLTNIIRTKELFLARLGSALFFAVLSGTLFLFPKNDDAGVFHKASFFILILSYFYWTSLEALPIFYQERETFEREYSGGAYRAISYTIATSLVYFPFYFLVAFIFSAISWWLINLPNVAELFLFQVFTIFIVLVVGGNFAMTLSTIMPDPMTAQTIGSAIFAVMLVFSGFFIKRAEIPAYWIYFHYVSLFKYAIDSELINGLQHHAYTSTKTNDQVLADFSVDGMSKWQGVGILIAWAFFYRGIFYYRLLTAFNGTRK